MRHSLDEIRRALPPTGLFSCDEASTPIPLAGVCGFEAVIDDVVVVDETA